MFNVVICERIRSGMGRNTNKTYINVLANLRQLADVDLATWLTNNAAHPWADPAFNEFLIELTEQEYLDFRDDVNPMFSDGQQNQPRWQQQTAGSGSAKDFGSWSDPENSGSTWQANVPIPDNRWIIRIYDDDPTTIGVHIAEEDLDEEKVTGFVVRYLKLFNSNDIPSNTNAQNQKTEIAGKQMIFDFTAGVTTFNVSTMVPGLINFPSNHEYRVVGPSGEKAVMWRIFGRTLEVEE